MSRRTIPVAQVVEWVNTRLDGADSTLALTDSAGKELTAEQAFRLGAASLLETILHATDNYRGYNFLPDKGITWDGDNKPTFVDETRRFYYGLPA